MFDFDAKSQLTESDRASLLARIDHDCCDLSPDGLINGSDVGILLAAGGRRGIGDIGGSILVDAIDLGPLLVS